MSHVCSLQKEVEVNVFLDFFLFRKCALSGMSRLCHHRIKLGDKGSYYYISPSSRARVTAPLSDPCCSSVAGV